MENLETIFSSDSPVECYLIKSKLENEGVECFVFDDNIISVYPFLSNAVGGVKLKVYERQKELAEKILAEKNTFEVGLNDNEIKDTNESRDELTTEQQATCPFGRMYDK
jgi:hypothetical protein